MCANYLNPKSFTTRGNEAVRVFGTAGMIEITDGATRSHWYDGTDDRGAIDVSESDCRDYLDLYLEHIAKVAYCDITQIYKSGGLQAICDHYVDNFRKDGDEKSVTADLTEKELTMQVHCPAFHNSPPALHPDRIVGPFFCQCCQKLNKGILAESGYELQVEQTCPGDCAWKIGKKGESL